MKIDPRFDDPLSELGDLAETAAQVAFAAGRAVPPQAALRRRLMQRIRKRADSEIQVWKSWQEEPTDALNVVRAAGGEWSTVMDGVHVKQLNVDPARGDVTMLVRMDPGSSYPSHRHGGAEQCFVLEGELHVGDDTTLQKGDFQCMREESVHGTQWTETGCLLLIVSSQRDELLAQ